MGRGKFGKSLMSLISHSFLVFYPKSNDDVNSNVIDDLLNLNVLSTKSPIPTSWLLGTRFSHQNHPHKIINFVGQFLL